MANTTRKHRFDPHPYWRNNVLAEWEDVLGAKRGNKKEFLDEFGLTKSTRDRMANEPENVSLAAWESIRVALNSALARSYPPPMLAMRSAEHYLLCSIALDLDERGALAGITESGDHLALAIELAVQDPGLVVRAVAERTESIAQRLRVDKSNSRPDSSEKGDVTPQGALGPARAEEFRQDINRQVRPRISKIKTQTRAGATPRRNGTLRSVDGGADQEPRQGDGGRVGRGGPKAVRD